MYVFKQWVLKISVFDTFSGNFLCFKRWFLEYLFERKGVLIKKPALSSVWLLIYMMRCITWLFYLIIYYLSGNSAYRSSYWRQPRSKTRQGPQRPVQTAPNSNFAKLSRFLFISQKFVCSISIFLVFSFQLSFW